MAYYKGLVEIMEQFIINYKKEKQNLPTREIFNQKLTETSQSKEFNGSTKKQLRIYLQRFFDTQKSNHSLYRKKFIKKIINDIVYIDVLKQ